MFEEFLRGTIADNHQTRCRKYLTHRPHRDDCIGDALVRIRILAPRGTKAGDGAEERRVRGQAERFPNRLQLSFDAGGGSATPL